MFPFLSLCMIVRNDGDRLERCLSSAAPFVDEIIVLDTGSIDDTKEIAARYTPHVFDSEWSQDFAAARNAAVAKASSPWILMLDADEYLEVSDLSDLREFLGKEEGSVPVGIVLPICNFVGSEGSGKISESKAIRVFRRHPDLRFERPIHEQLVSRSGTMRELEYPLTIYHTGYTAETITAKRKNERNQAILSRLRAEGRFTPYDAFLMGNEYYSQDRYEEAVACYEEARHPSQKDKSWLPLSEGNLVQCLIKLERYTEAYRLIRESRTRWADTCDFYWLEGYLLARIGLDESAVGSLRECLRIANRDASKQTWLISPNFGSTLPLQQLAVLHLRRFEVQDAVTCLTQLAYANPNHKAALVQLLKLVRSESTEGIASLLSAICPDPEPYRSDMMADACLQAGLPELATRYGGSEASPPELPRDAEPALVAERCMRLFRVGDYEAFDRLLSEHESDALTLAQLLGDELFEDRQYELALDYYSLLLQKGLLSARGYENLARLYFAQGDREEGLEFAAEAIRLAPERIEPYTLFLVQCVPGDGKAKEIEERLMARFPGLRGFPLLHE